MNKLYSVFTLFVALVLLTVFQYSHLRLFWNTEWEHTGQYFRTAFFQDQKEDFTRDLNTIGGRLTSSSLRHARYQINREPDNRIYVRVTVIDKNTAFSQGSQFKTYKNLTHLKFAKGKGGAFQSVFKAQQGFSAEIELTPLLDDTNSFTLLLDDSSSGRNDNRVIGAMEIYTLNANHASRFPRLDILLLFVVIPLLWLWFLTYVLEMGVPLALGLTVMLLFISHTITLVQMPLMIALMWLSGGVCLLLMLLKRWVTPDTGPLPVIPYFWMLMLLGVSVRWREVLLQSTRRLEQLEQQQSYYNSAVLMDLFSPKGFYSGIPADDPFFPLLIKLTGQFFGFSEFHMHYVSFGSAVLLLFLTYWLGRKLFDNPWMGLGAAALLAQNELLIRESALRLPLGFEACLFLGFVYILVIRPFQWWWAWGLLSGILALIWALLHASFVVLILVLLLIGALWQILRADGWNWSKSVLASTLATLVLVIGFWPHVSHTYQHHRKDAFAASTRYISQVANLEFANTSFFPNRLDVVLLGEKAPRYQAVTTSEYFFHYHKTSELLAYPFLGYLGVVGDGMAALFNVADVQVYWGEKFLVEHWRIFRHDVRSSIGVVIRLLLLLLMIGVMARNYKTGPIVLVLATMIVFPHTFFYGVLLVKGISVYLLYRYQHVICLLPFLAWGFVALAVAVGRGYRGMLKNDANTIDPA